jgi:hypothetical protein
MIDFNKDRFMDIFAANGFGQAPFSFGPHQLFHNQGNNNN